MNIIYNKLNELKPKYWIHMEDDFIFHKKLNYIDDSIAALNSKYCVDNNVKQILFNRNRNRGNYCQHFHHNFRIIWLYSV